MAKKENNETISVELTTDELEEVAGGDLGKFIMADDGDNYFIDNDFRATVQCTCDK